MPTIPPEQTSNPASLAARIHASLSSNVCVVQILGKYLRDVSIFAWQRVTPTLRKISNCSFVKRPCEAHNSIPLHSSCILLYASTTWSNSLPTSVLPAVTIEKRWAPFSSFTWHAFTKESTSITSYSSAPVWWWLDWAQNRQFSLHRPARPLIIVHKSTWLPHNSFRILSAPWQSDSKSPSIKKVRSSSFPKRLPSIISFTSSSYIIKFLLW